MKKCKEPKVLNNLYAFIGEAQERLKNHMNTEFQHYVGSLVVKNLIDAPTENGGFMLSPSDFCDFQTDFFNEYIKMMKLWQRVDPVLTKMAVMPKQNISGTSNEKPGIMN